MIGGIPRPLWFTDECKSVRYTQINLNEQTLIADYLKNYQLQFINDFNSHNYSDPHFCMMQPSTNPYKGKVAVLMDRNAYSSNDQFITAIKAAAPDRVSLLGEKSRGGSGGGGSVVLKNSGTRVSFSIFANWGFDGHLLEDEGTTPDIPVILDIEDQLQQNDPFIEKALEVLNR